MSKVRCSVCKTYVEKDEAIYIGLSYVCGDNCLKEARKRRRDEKRAARGRNPIPADLRQQVRDRDGNACRYCRRPTDLQLHHIRYRSEGGPHEERNLITLCSVHHALMHSSKERWQPVLLGLIEEQYANGHFYLVLQYERATISVAHPLVTIELRDLEGHLPEPNRTQGEET